MEQRYGRIALKNVQLENKTHGYQRGDAGSGIKTLELCHHFRFVHDLLQPKYNRHAKGDCANLP
jgi:hypothetical protein